jgi:hypothetical protein
MRRSQQLSARQPRPVFPAGQGSRPSVVPELPCFAGVVGASDPRSQTDVRVSYFSQYVYKLLLDRVHFRTRLTKRPCGAWQAGLLKRLSQAFAPSWSGPVNVELFNT